MNQEKTSTFNGWSSRATWAVNLWITNDQDSYFRWRNRVNALLRESPTQNRIHSVLARLAEEIRDVTEDECAIKKGGLAADLMNGALAEVDWHEIAQTFLDEADESGGGSEEQ